MNILLCVYENKYSGDLKTRVGSIKWAEWKFHDFYSKSKQGGKLDIFCIVMVGSREEFLDF